MKSIPHRVQLSRKAGFKLPPNTVVVSRPSKWGNPFRVTKTCTAKEAVELYEAWLRFGGLALLIGLKAALHGKNLACWCKLIDDDGHRVPCHADVLLRLANPELSTP